MGFRSTFITEDIRIIVPDWFVKKHKKNFFINYNRKRGVYTLPIASRFEFKTYSQLATDLYDDLQKVLNDFNKENPPVVEIAMMWFHECDGVTRVKIRPNEIVFAETSEDWTIVDDVTHDYCYSHSKEEPNDNPI